MKTPQQLTLTRDFTVPQICPFPELPQLLTQAAASGFEATRLERRKDDYRVTFQLMPSAADGREARPADMQAGNSPEIKVGTLLFAPPQQGCKALARPSMGQPATLFA
jgi:hypothetical protein